MTTDSSHISIEYKGSSFVTIEDIQNEINVFKERFIVPPYAVILDPTSIDSEELAAFALNQLSPANIQIAYSKDRPLMVVSEETYNIMSVIWLYECTLEQIESAIEKLEEDLLNSIHALEDQ